MSNVIHGKNGYLFLAGDQNAVINQHTGDRPLKDRQLAKWKKVFTDRKRYFDKHGIKFYLQVIPDKHPVYSQYLPDDIQLIKKRNIDLFLDNVEPVMQERINYPLDVILSASNMQQVYYKRDSHWTDRGAYISYLELMKIITNDFPNLSILQTPVFTTGTFQGDLARMAGLEAESTDFFNQAKFANTLFDNHVNNTGHIKIFSNSQAKNDLTLLLFGSSSTLYTLKFLTHDIKNIIFYWSGNFDFPAIQYFKPDLIINQIRERHLIRPADDTVGLNTLEMAFVKSFAEIGEAISPVPFNKRLTLENCLAKAGNKSNQAYLKYIKELCTKLGLNQLYEFALNVNRTRYSFRWIRFMVKVKLCMNQIVAGGISKRLNLAIGHQSRH